MSSHARALAEGLAAFNPVSTVTRRSAVAIDADERNLRALLAVIAAVALGLGGAVTIVFVNHGVLMFGIAAAGLVAVGAVMLVVRRSVTRTTLAAGARFVSWALLALVTVLLLAGNRAPMLALTALLGVLVAVPYVDGREVRRLALASFGLSIAVAVGWASIAPPTAGPGMATEAVTRFVGVVVSSGLCLFAIVHVGARLTAGAQRYRDLFERVPVGMYRTTPEGRFLDVNAAFVEMFGLDSPEELANISASTLYADPGDRAVFRDTVDGAGVARRVEFRARRPDGSLFWVRDSALLVRDSVGTPLYYEGILEDVTEHKHREQKLEHRASVDALTGLANRAVLIEELEQALSGATADQPVALLFVDLDDFKQVNDRFGHATGDTLLADAGHRLREATRGQDTTARFGGDEFAVVLERPADHAVAESVARRIAAAFREPFDVAGEQVVIGASIGIAIAKRPVPSAELIEQADNAMYRAKSVDRIEVFGR